MGKVLMSGVAKKATVPEKPVDTTLANNTPETIQEVAKAGLAANYWSVGDMVPITLNGTVGELTFSNEAYYAFILGFDHNSSIEGSNTIHFQFGKTSAGVDIAFCDSLYESSDTTSTDKFKMNTTVNYSGGWEASLMRTAICPAFLAAMPTDWQSIIVPCTKYTNNTSGDSDTASYVTATTDDIFLLAEFEVQGTRTNANSAEQNYQKQYDYYAAGNSKVKYKHNATTTACRWWTRSVKIALTPVFSGVNTDGGANGGRSPYYSLGFAPAFMVA